VFFCIVIGAFAIGTAAPNLEKVSTARAAAFLIWNLIDRVMTVVVALGFCCFSIISVVQYLLIPYHGKEWTTNIFNNFSLVIFPSAPHTRSQSLLHTGIVVKQLSRLSSSHCCM